MATSDVEICNSALAKLGAESITSLSDTTRRAVLCNRQYDKIRKKMLRMHPWNFAIKRVWLSPITETSTSVDAGTDTFTATGNITGVTGEKYKITLNSGTMPGGLTAGNTYYIIKTAATTFKLATNQTNAAAGTAIDITSAPTFNATFTLKSAWGEEEHCFTLPSDYLRGLREKEKTFISWKVEGSRVVADQDEFNLMYIADISDTTLFTPDFDELLSLALAKEISYSLVQSNSLLDRLEREYQIALRDVRSFDAQEGTPEELEGNTWLTERL